MMKKFNKILCSFLALVAVAAPIKATAQAWDGYEGGYDGIAAYDGGYGYDGYYGNNDCCCNDWCSGPDPLCPCAFGVQFNAGISPITTTERGRIWLTNPLLTPPVFSIGRVPRFRDEFDTPWIVSGLLTYNACCNVQFFAEFNYRQADGKKRHHSDSDSDFIFRERHKEFQSWAWYLGSRYFFPRFIWCNQIAPFFGLKAGLVNFKRVKHRLEINEVFVDNSSFWHGNSAISAGLQFGLDYAFCDGWGAVLTFEAVGTGGFKGNRNHEVNPLLTGGITNISIGQQGIHISYPVTVGVRYQF